MKKYSLYAVFFFLVLYIAGFSNNVSADGYAYTNSAMTGEDMFSPHHLLYSPFCYVVLKVCSVFSADALRLIQIMNALFAAGALFFVRLILQKMQKSEFFVFCGVCFSASAFGFMRFATENECYIIPLFISIVSLYFLQKFYAEGKKSDVFLSGLLLAIGCLFHQMVVLQWLVVAAALLISKEKRNFFWFVCSFVTVPCVYWAVNCAVNNTTSLNGLMTFVLHDYISGAADAPCVKKILLLGPVSFFRTFFQLHGYMFALIRQHAFINGLIITVTILLICAAIISILKIRKKDIAVSQNNTFIYILIAVFLAYLLFATVNNANAEFMVMLPCLSVMIYSCFVKKYQLLMYLSCAMLVWNMCFGIIPYKQKDLFWYHGVTEFMHDNTDCNYLITFKPETENEYNYRYNTKADNIYYAARFDSIMQQELIRSGRCIYTDCLQSDKTYTRYGVISKQNGNTAKHSEQLYKYLNKGVVTDSVTVHSLTGNKILYKICY